MTAMTRKSTSTIILFFFISCPEFSIEPIDPENAIEENDDAEDIRFLFINIGKYISQQQCAAQGYIAKRKYDAEPVHDLADANFFH
jgi:hypothetical protein